MTQVQTKMTKEEMELKFKEWAQSEYVKINKYCNSKGYQLTGLNQKKCRYMPPMVAVWYVKTSDKMVDLWVISGDFPTDMTVSKVAKDAREAIRHFSLAWQLQAAKLEDSIAEGKIELNNMETQTKFVKELINQAESLYEIHNNDKLWEQADLS
jgi:hypothetical protein